MNDSKEKEIELKQVLVHQQETHRNITLEYLYQTRVISAAQLIRIRLFLERQALWLGDLCNVGKLESDVLYAIDIYLWCIDPILQRHPKRVDHLARLWVEKKIVEMDPVIAAELIDEEMNY